MTALDEGSARLRDLYLKHTTDKHPCPSAGFKPAFPASERPQTHALDRAATGICACNTSHYKKLCSSRY